METRTILQVILASIFLIILGLGGYIIYKATRKPETVIMTEVIKSEESKKEKINPWETKGPAAIELVKRLSVIAPVAGSEVGSPADQEKDKGKDKKKGEPETEQTTIGALMEREAFWYQTLKMPREGKPQWSVDWWGGTKYGPSYYMVRFAFKDAYITVGPSWLVDLKTAKIVPKNVLARVVMSPIKAVDDEYYDKHKQVVSALASHRFESGLNLGGALLMYFEQREESAEGDKILGWTIEHDRANLFRAYFQWIEAGEPTYAEFEFDYSLKALKPSNLQAASVMRIGEDFEKRERAKIDPGSYDAEAKQEDKRWIGPARKACQTPKLKDQCKALATMLEQRDVVEALEWLLTAQVESADDFEACKRAQKCKWTSKPAREGVYLVSYVFDLTGKKESSVSWEIALKDGQISPIDRRSTASWRAIYPRESGADLAPTPTPAPAPDPQ